MNTTQLLNCVKKYGEYANTTLNAQLIIDDCANKTIAAEQSFVGSVLSIMKQEDVRMLANFENENFYVFNPYNLMVGAWNKMVGIVNNYKSTLTTCPSQAVPAEAIEMAIAVYNAACTEDCRNTTTIVSDLQNDQSKAQAICDNNTLMQDLVIHITNINTASANLKTSRCAVNTDVKADTEACQNYLKTVCEASDVNCATVQSSCTEVINVHQNLIETCGDINTPHVGEDLSQYV